MVRKDLLEILKKVKPGIAQKEIVESMTYFYFTGKEIITYNDKIAIMYPFETDFSLFVKANDFFNFVSKSSAEDIVFKKKDTKLLAKTKNTQLTLTTIDDPNFVKRVETIKKSLTKMKWVSLPENFISSILLCMFAASKSETEQTLSCVCVWEGGCISSDNQRIASATFLKKLKLPTDNILLKASEIKNLTEINPTKMAVAKNWIHFKNADNCTFSIRRIAGSFPDFFSPLKFEGAAIELPKKLTEGTDLASIFVDDLQPSIDISIKKDLCLISVMSDSGDMKFRTKIKYSGEEFKFTINPDFLTEMLNHSTSLIITTDRAKLVTENFTYCTSLHGV